MMHFRTTLLGAFLVIALPMAQGQTPNMESTKPSVRIALPQGHVELRSNGILAGMLDLEWRGETEMKLAQIKIEWTGTIRSNSGEEPFRGTFPIYVSSMNRDDLGVALTESEPKIKTDCTATVQNLKLVAVETVPSNTLDRITWEARASMARSYGRQQQLIQLKAVEIQAKKAACAALFEAIANKKLSELTVAEDVARKSCLDAGFGP